ncbi:MAG: NUDIX hydrolase [Alphaproteobacteria bacterium]|nr:NUDIX hydrolase [Alphaproteobacteria bacterium]
MSTPSQHLPKLGASACVWRNGRVLLAQRAKPPAGIWALPGGHVELGESTAEAARRELMEETGLSARLDTLVGVFDVIRRDAAGTVTLHYAIACYGGLADAGEPVAASDAQAVEWADPDALGRYHLAPQVHEAVLRARQLLKL